MYDMAKLKNLGAIEKMVPDAMKAFWEFDKAALAEGALSVKTKELIAVAVAHTTQCPYCLDIHAKAARKAGATDQEIAEAAIVAAALRAGAAIVHATHVVEG